MKLPNQSQIDARRLRGGLACMFQRFAGLGEETGAFKPGPWTRGAHGGSNEAECDEPVEGRGKPAAEGNIGRGEIRAGPTCVRFGADVADRFPAPAPEFDVVALLVGSNGGEITDEGADQNIGLKV